MGFVEVKVNISKQLQIVAAVFFLRLGYFLIICFPVANFSHCNLATPDKPRYWFANPRQRLTNLVIRDCALKDAEHCGKMPVKVDRNFPNFFDRPSCCQTWGTNYDVVVFE